MHVNPRLVRACISTDLKMAPRCCCLQYVERCFNSASLFHKALKEAFEAFCNKPVAGSQMVELMANYCNALLKKVRCRAGLQGWPSEACCSATSHCCIWQRTSSGPSIGGFPHQLCPKQSRTHLASAAGWRREAQRRGHRGHPGEGHQAARLHQRQGAQLWRSCMQRHTHASIQAGSLGCIIIASFAAKLQVLWYSRL